MALRTVGAKLVAEVSDYNAGMRSAARSTKGFADELDDAARAGEQEAAAAGMAGAATERLGNKMREAARDASRLDREIGGLTGSVLKLAKQYAATGDRSILTKMREEQSKLRDAVNVKKLLGDAGDEGGRAFYAKLSGRLGPLMASMPIGPWIIPAIAAATPAIAATIGAAVSGGVAVAGIGGGIALAARDPRVKASAAVLGKDIGDILGQAAQPFVPATLRALDKVRAEFRKLQPEFAAIFATGSGRLDGLVDGLIDGMDQLVGSLRRVNDQAGPVVDVLGEHLPQMLGTAGDAMERLSSSTQYSAASLDSLLTAVELTVTGTAAMVEWLNKAGDAGLFGVSAFAWLGEMTKGQSEAADTAAGSSKALADALAKAKEEAAGTGNAAKEAADRLKELDDAFNDLFDSQMALDRANIRYRQGMHDLREELEHGKRTLSANSEEGRKNRSVVLDQIQVINDMRRARLRHGEALDSVNAKYAKDVQGLRAAMHAAGFTKAQIDKLIGAYQRIPAKADTKVAAPGAPEATKKAHDFRGALDEIPSRRNTHIDAPGAGAARMKALDFNFAVAKIPSSKTTTVSCVGVGPSIGELSRLRGYINSVPRYIGIHARVTTEGNVRVPGGTIQRRWGGITEHAQTGLLREAAVYSPQGPARYAFAEPATGGEAFVPRNGDPGRSLAILDRAASWYDAKVTSGRRGGGTTVVNQLHLHAGVVGSRMELETWFVGMFNRLDQQGRL